MDNDIYLLKHVDNKILINNNDQEIILIKDDLASTESISLPGSFYMYDIYSNKAENSAVIYCPEEQSFIYVNLYTKEITLIPLHNMKDILSSLYCWDGDTIILSTYNNKFYSLDINIRQIIPASKNHVQKTLPSFYHFYTQAKKFQYKYQINSLQQSFIYEHNEEIVFFDVLNNQKINIKQPDNHYHDIAFAHHHFVFISEKELILHNGMETHKFFTEDPSYIFLRAFLTKEHNNLILIALVSNTSDNKTNKIIKYVIDVN